MNKLLILFTISLFTHFFALANDGSFLASGNTLIPINNDNISIDKEVLTIKKIGENLLVTVDYTFYNHGEESEVLVGFEANTPFGDVDYQISEKGNPYIKNFTVQMNDENLKHGIKIVDGSQYIENKRIKEMNMADIEQLLEQGEFPDHIYVYHFNTKFKKGINRIIHTYTFEQSYYITNNFNFDYILTAANRWKGGVIKDFTLILDMGDFQDFYIEKSFFTYATDWNLEGIGYIEDSNNSFYKPELKSAHFAIKNGKIQFQQDNFRPKGELYLFSERYLAFDHIDHSKYIPFNIDLENPTMYEDLPIEDKRILRNYPFARNGYDFKNKNLSQIYSNMFWYESDSAYSGERNTLTNQEKQWVDYFDTFLNQ